MDPWLQDVANATPGFMPIYEGLALEEAAALAAPLGPILEIGTYCGKSAMYLGSGARRGGGTVVTVDHHRGSEEHQPGWEYHDPSLVDPQAKLIDTLPTARQRLHEAGMDDIVVLIVGSSAQVGAFWSTPLSMLFIDGGHTEQAAAADYRTWARHVVPGGLLAIHDVFPDPADGGRAPWHVYETARRSGMFDDVSATGSLRILRRVAGLGAYTSVGTQSGHR